jgi:tRNA pseudouridine38-40 synthase
LDIDAMRTAAARLAGEHDFTSFRSVECQAKSPIKTLDEIRITNHVPACAGMTMNHRPRTTNHESRITIDFSARSFLHHQVRNIVGTLVEIGRGKPLDVDKILAARDRSAAGSTAPARGLFFMSGEY